MESLEVVGSVVFRRKSGGVRYFNARVAEFSSEQVSKLGKEVGCICHVQCLKF